jgi:AcrR family transcriptional regulator
MVRSPAVDADRGEHDHAYHHGNLRRALMDDALKIIRDGGVDALTLRDLARRAGVTHAAPHHHFRDKAALLAALSVEGLTLLDKAMTAAEERAGTAPMERLLGVGRAYIMFAAEHPEYSAVMFRPEIWEPECGLRDEPCQGAAWRHLVDGIVMCQQAGVAPLGDPLPIAIHLWSLVHGLATLWNLGPLQAVPLAGGLEGLADMILGQAGRDLMLAARGDCAPPA